MIRGARFGRKLKHPKTLIARAPVCIATVVFVFLLPLMVPLASRPIISASYVAGYSNSAGILAVVCLSALVFFSTKQTPEESGAADLRTLRPSSPFVLCAFLGTLTMQATLCFLVVRSHLRYLGDAGYFIEALTVRLDTGRPLYSAMEFAYGPLLLLPEVVVAKALRLSPTVAYYLVYLIESALGLLLIVWIMNQLPISRFLRQWAVVLFSLGTVTPHLGLNYTFIRFGAAPAILLWCSARRSLWQTAGALAAGEVFLVLLSPELAIAMLPAITLFCLLRVRQRGVGWAWVGVAPLLALALALCVLGRSYLQFVTQFARGTLNLPIGPYPHIVVLLIATLWLVPRMVRKDAAHEGTTDHTALLCLFVLGLMFLPAALGRCDPLHVFFNGTVLMLLSLVAVTRSKRSVQRLWVGAFLLMVVWEQKVNEHLFAGRTAAVLCLTVMPHLPERVTSTVLQVVGKIGGPEIADQLDPDQDGEAPVDLVKLGQVTRHQAIATPLPISPNLERGLLASGTSAPGYYAFWMDVFSAPAEERSIQEFRRAHCLLLPADMEMSVHEAETPARLADLQGMTLPYRARNKVPYFRGDLLQKELMRNWSFSGRFGDYVLYRNLMTQKSS